MDYWQRLRRDHRSGVAGIAAIVAVVAANVSIVSTLVGGSLPEQRANPLYWGLMLPGIWWVSGMTGYGPLYVRTWKPAMAIAVLAAGACFLLAQQRGAGSAMEAGALVVTALAAITSIVALRGSLVDREGPAR